MKAKTTKKAGRWVTKKQGNKIVAKRLEPSADVYTDPSSMEFSSAVLPAPEGSRKLTDILAWEDKPQEPGLHLLRFVIGDSFGYQVIRAVLVNDGLSECYQIKFASGPGGDVNMSEWTSPEFQKVKE